MRKRFELQTSLDFVPISEISINLKCRDATQKIAKALLEVYNSTEYNERIFSVLEGQLKIGGFQTGRRGMDLWQIFVLSQFRLGLNIGYDRLQHMVDNDKMLRTLLGIEATKFGTKHITFSYQNLIDNVGLLTDEMLKGINEVIVDFGDKKVFKKKLGAASILKTDSYVVGSNVHFPTDYSLLWDAARKSIDMVRKIIEENKGLKGWRKIYGWRKKVKNLCRRVGQNKKNGGKDKEKKLKMVVSEYLGTCTELVHKIIEFLPSIPQDLKSQLIKSELEKYACLTIQFIGQLERRVIKGEKIPHGEKLFSIFEQYTEWINKGKQNPSVELGKKLAITTNQNDLIIDYRVIEGQADSEIVIDLASDVLKKGKVQGWSFDKGFYSKTNKDLLSKEIGLLVMPKKGKPNKEEKEEEGQAGFIKYRHKHSAVESNINELAHRGLDRCPDKGYAHYKRYIGAGVCAYNLHKIGAKLREIELEELDKLRHKKAA